MLRNGGLRVAVRVQMNVRVQMKFRAGQRRLARRNCRAETAMRHTRRLCSLGFGPSGCGLSWAGLRSPRPQPQRGTANSLRHSIRDRLRRTDVATSGFCMTYGPAHTAASIGRPSNFATRNLPGRATTSNIGPPRSVKMARAARLRSEATPTWWSGFHRLVIPISPTAALSGRTAVLNRSSPLEGGVSSRSAISAASRGRSSGPSASIAGDRSG
jgi:hypothetical protein